MFPVRGFVADKERKSCEREMFQMDTEQRSVKQKYRSKQREQPMSFRTIKSFSLSLELKSVICRNSEFKGLVNTGAELCLMRRRVFLKLGVGVSSLMGRQRVLTGIGESQVLAFGSLVTKVVIDGIDMSVEFHVMPDDDMKLDAILGTTILNSVDMMVTKSGTIFSPRVQSVQERPTTGSDDNQAGQSTCMQLISEFESLCMISTKDSKTVSEVDLEHLSQKVVFEVESLIEIYKPKRNLTSPVEMKILLKGELPVFQHP